MSIITSMTKTVHEEYEEGIVVRQVETREVTYELEERDRDYDENM